MSKIGYYKIALILTLAQVLTYGQNLVLNGSFELNTSCPNQLGQINLCTDWINGDLNGTCDYYSATAGCTGNFSPPLLKPTSFLTLYQKPLNQNSFAGLIPFYGHGGMPSYVEYLQGSFSNSLTPNQLYYIEFYINSASQQKFFIHDISALITSNQITITPGNPYSPQILPLMGKIYKDTTNWMRINGYYTANGGEKYITIGNFTPYGQELKDSVLSGINEAYYFVDSVGVYEVTQWLPWSAGPDRTINSGDSVLIGNPCSDYSIFNWVTSTGTKTYLTDSTVSWPYAKPMQNTTYYVKKTQGTNVFTDTVNVFVNGSGIANYGNTSSFALFPNPAREFVKVSLSSSYGGKFQIYGLSGNLVLSIEAKKGERELTISTSELDGGIYLCRLVNREQVSYSDKLVIVK